MTTGPSAVTSDGELLTSRLAKIRLNAIADVRMMPVPLRVAQPGDTEGPQYRKKRNEHGVLRQRTLKIVVLAGHELRSLRIKTTPNKRYAKQPI